MLVDNVEQAFGTAINTVKYLTLAVEDKFLQVKRYSFCNAKIFGVLRYHNTHLIAHAKKMINGVAAGKNNGRVCLDVYLLLAKFFGRYRFQFDKGVKVQFNSVLTAQFKIRRFIAFRP